MYIGGDQSVRYCTGHAPFSPADPTVRIVATVASLSLAACGPVTDGPADRRRCADDGDGRRDRAGVGERAAALCARREHRAVAHRLPAAGRRGTVGRMVRTTNATR